MSKVEEQSVPEKRNKQGALRTKRKMLKRVLLYLLVLIGTLIIAILLFTLFYPTFGGNPSNEQTELYETFDNYQDGKFINPPSQSMNRPVVIPDSDTEEQDTRPSGELPVSDIDWDQIQSNEDSLTWLGHSAFILRMDNQTILIDPMLSPRASPVSFAGPKRFDEGWLDGIDDMPPIDAVLITHDHYDHLDYRSIQKLTSKVDHFFVPHGVGNHLVEWGVAEEAITELNWWDETEFQGMTLALTPSKHFSGRGIMNRNSTLWGGWAILGQQTRFYLSGDGGYDAHFKEIGDKYGPFDMALIEGGQYDSRWLDSHMFPEEAVQAHIDVQADRMMLMHWGAFTLARHGWAEPVERAVKAAEENDVNIIAPQMGERVPMDASAPLPVSAWWK